MQLYLFQTNRIVKRPDWILSVIALVSVIFIFPAFAGTSEKLKDIDITLAVDRQLQNDDSVPDHLIDVQTKDGIVTLRGPVENLLARERAAEVAATVKGVRSVVNLIEVMSVIRTDEEIRNDVQLALLDDPAADLYDINVNVRDGIVTLAEDVVSRVKGVTRVINNLTANRPWTPQEDWAIRQDIMDELWWSPFIDKDDISVTVTDGVATLVGVVDTLRERRVATENAFEGGAKHVRNHLKVRQGPESLQP